MAKPKLTLFSLALVLLLISAACSGFLVGRTVKMKQEGKMEQLHQVGEQVVDVSTVLQRGVDVVKRVILR